MLAQLEIDENLLKEALALSEITTENQLIEEALREYIQRRQKKKCWICLARSTMKKIMIINNKGKSDESDCVAFGHCLCGVM